MSNIDPHSKLTSRDEWQADVRGRFPFAETGSPTQAPYDTTDYIDRELSEYAMEQATINQAISHVRTTDAYHGSSLVEALEKAQKDEKLMSSFGQLALWKENAWTTNEYLEGSLDVFDARYRKGLQEAAKTGVLSKEEYENHRQAREHTAVRTVSPSILHVAEKHGHYDAHRDEVVAHDSADDAMHQDQRVATLAHEFGHKESGGTFVRSTDGKVHRTRVGFVNIRNPHIAPPNDEIVMNGKLGWNEAANEHRTRGVLSTDFQEIDPAKRTNDEKIYFGYRKVLADVYKKGGGDMKITTLMAALAEDTGPDGGFSARRALIQEIKNVYGWGAMRKIEKLMQSAEQEPDRIDEVLACIHPPERNENGNVVKLGFIDEFEDVMSRMLREQGVTK